MESSQFDRRKFHELLAGAFGGLIVGTGGGCDGGKVPAGPGGSSADADNSAAAAGEKTPAGAVVHACRGLNECKGQATDGKNACAGQGICATSKHHSCGGQNECKNLGGCGSTAGANDCKGQGHCAVPMHSGAWETARKHFEDRMTAKGKKFGPAPAAPKEG